MSHSSTYQTPEQRKVTEALAAFKGRPCAECGAESVGVLYFRRAGLVTAVYPSCAEHAKAYRADGAKGIPTIYATELLKMCSELGCPELATGTAVFERGETTGVIRLCSAHSEIFQKHGATEGQILLAMDCRSAVQ